MNMAINFVEGTRILKQRLQSLDPANLNVGALFVATSLGLVLGYVYLLLVARELGVIDFGEFGALLAVYYVISQPSGYLEFCVTTVVARSRSQNLNALKPVSGLLLEVTLISGSITTLTIFGRGQLATLLGVSESGIVLISLAGGGFALMSVIRGYLQGLERFYLLAINRTSEKLVTLLVGAFLLVSGFGLTGAILAIVAATMITFFLTLLISIKGGVRRQQSDSISDIMELSERPFSIPSTFRLTQFRSFINASARLMAVLVILGVLTNIDIIVVNRFSSPETAGMYFSITLVSKVVFLLGLSYLRVLYPRLISVRQSRRAIHMTPKFARQALLIIWLVVIIGVVSSLGLGSLIPETLFGSEYAGPRAWLPLHMYYMGCVSTVMLMLYIKIVVGQWPLIVAVGIISLISAVLLSAFYPGVVPLLAALAAIGSVLALTSVITTITKWGWTHTWVENHTTGVRHTSS